MLMSVRNYYLRYIIRDKLSDEVDLIDKQRSVCQICNIITSTLDFCSDAVKKTLL